MFSFSLYMVATFVYNKDICDINILMKIKTIVFMKHSCFLFNIFMKVSDNFRPRKQLNTRKQEVAICVVKDFNFF